MIYDGLKTEYWNAQAERVDELRKRIVQRSEAPRGRVVPDDGDLVIGTGRHLPLTVTFLDISRFSRRRASTASEQEMILRILNLFITEMIRIVEDYGGHVEKNTGDGLMAYFEDRPEDGSVISTQRAVACCLTMFATNDLLISPILRATSVPPIQFRVSMDYGDVTVARIGAARRFNANVAIGNVANFASKMLTQVKPGEFGINMSHEFSGNLSNPGGEIGFVEGHDLSDVGDGVLRGARCLPLKAGCYQERRVTACST